MQTAFAVFAGSLLFMGIVHGQTSSCAPPPTEMCCTRMISNPRATLTASFVSPHALTSITIWDQNGIPLLQFDNQTSALDISIGTRQSLTGCFVMNSPVEGSPISVPAGFEERGLLCGSVGTYLTVSVRNFMKLTPSPELPNGIAVKICTRSASESTVPPHAKLLITSSKASPLECYVNAAGGLVLRDFDWFIRNDPSSMGPSPAAASMARCVSFRYFCEGANDWCSAGDARSFKTIFGLQNHSSCDSMAEQPDVFRDLKCCSTRGCNLDPNPAPPPPPGPAPMACQVLGVQVQTAIPAINSTSNCDGAGKCYDMTPLQMKDYIGTPYMDMLEPNHFSCIDGRHDDEIVATPAGDMGIFLSSAFVYINGTSSPTDFSLARIKALLRDFIMTFRSKTTRFYYHTDEHSVERVLTKLEELAVDGGPGVEHFCSPSYVPPPAAKATLIQLLADPAIGIGCGHVKYMAKIPQDYGLPSSDFVTNTVQALWELKWGELREYINVEPLGHDHNEQAVLSITSINGCDGFTPLITQRTSQADTDPGGSDSFYSGQVFVNHDFSVKVIRDKVAHYFVGKDMSPHTTQSEFRSRLDHLADDIQLMKSAVLLAAHRPLFTATINGELYTPDYWNDTEPSAFLMCFVGTPTGLVLRESVSEENSIPLSEQLRCVRFAYECQSSDQFCSAGEVGTTKTVFGFGKQSDCAMMMSYPNRFRDLRCCSSDGCNYKPVVGPSTEDVGASPALMCQLLGVRVSELIPAIAATSNCGGGICYNMTEFEMKEYIGTPKMVPLEPNHFSCIDGRHDNEIVATPAGDIGIFLSSVFVYINATSTPMDFTVLRIKPLLKNFITTFRSKTTKFYYHTDEHAIERIVAQLEHLEIPNATEFENMCATNFVPPHETKEILLGLLTNPAVGIGCGHVKYMALYPLEYGITSADLVTNTVSALWELKWGELREYIDVEPLGHNHAEQAVLSITSIEGCDGFSPLVTQRTAEADGAPGQGSLYTGQIFVNHDYSVKVIRNKVAKYFTQMGGMSPLLTVAAFRSKLDRLADDIQLLKSAILLAPYRPLFTATITGRTFIPDTRRRSKRLTQARFAVPK